MSIPENNKFIEFQDKIISMPLWVKQAIFLNLKENLEANITIPFVNTMAKDTTFQFYIPSITFKGRQELETRELGLDINLYKFLEFAQNKTNIAEITIISRWTLEECATCFLDAIEKEFIEKPSSDLINGTVAYLSGTIRLGEYFTRIGKITIEQLDQALRTQKQIIESSGDRIGIGEVMLNLNFITEKDMQAILHIKMKLKKDSL